MKLLLHSCCAPCTIYPLEQCIVKDTTIDEVQVLFYNPNIHPFTEYRNRLTSLKNYLSDIGVRLHIPEDYELETFFRKVANNESSRCNICYSTRMDYIFTFAKENEFDSVSTTLLYSKYQNHNVIRKLCESKSLDTGLDFYYDDFREGWQFGIDSSIEREMYRQKYCGCIYSEQERYDNRLKKKMRRLKRNEPK